MNWRNVKLVWQREVRDQLRDRRTLFMVAVLPLLMYPLMGTTYLQLAQFKKTHTARVLLVDTEQLESVEGLPQLVEQGGFNPTLFDGAGQAGLFDITLADSAQAAQMGVREKLDSGGLDLAVVFPANFAERLRQHHEQIKQLGESRVKDFGAIAPMPRPILRYNAAEDASRVAYSRVREIINRWREDVMMQGLAAGNVPRELVVPIEIKTEDIAGAQKIRTGLWATLLPFVVFVWALTGAFYPAVDLCAGEKERGTLETLLASPAQRSEIVWGKLLTVMLFSIATAMLNLASLGLTGQFFFGSMQSAAGSSINFGLPPLSSLGWVLVALPPIAAMFSALSIACASFAKSTKEGQYYFMPLFMGAMPLMLMPLSPGVELDLGNSLVPLMGVVLLLRSLIEGQYAEAFQYFVPVTIVTMTCCLLSVKWAVHQFNQESVLFREGERFNVGQWLKKLVREPTELPTPSMAMACIALVFVLKFFAEALVVRLQPHLGELEHLGAAALISQACILAPAILMALLLVRRRLAAMFGVGHSVPRTAAGVALAVGMAILAHPVVIAMQQVIQYVFPVSKEFLQFSTQLDAQLGAVSLWVLVLFMGIIPGLCEEITFRGFVLGGLRQGIRPGWAVGVTAVAFGMAHGILQQSINAAIIGLLLGWLTIYWGSIWPAIAFHMTNNSLFALFSWLQREDSEGSKIEFSGWRMLLRLEDNGDVSGYQWYVVALAALGLGVLLLISLLISKPSKPRATTATAPPR